MSRYKSAAGETAVMQAYDAILAEWTIPYESRILETCAGDTHILLAGDETAPPLLMLHGAYGNAASWGYVAPDFAKNHRLIAIDIIGQPTKSAESSKPSNKAYNAAWLNSLMDSLKLEKASIMGLSYGGWQTLNFYFHHPERFEKMILLSPLSIVAINVLPIMWQGLTASLRGETGFYKMAEFAGIGKGHAAMKDFFAMSALHMKLPVMMIYPYSPAALRKIQCPVLLICGGKDNLINGKKSTERFRKLVPHAEVHFLPDASHVLPASQVEIAIPLIQKFLES